MQRQRVQQLMEPRSSISLHRWRGPWQRGLTKVIITVSPFHHFTILRRGYIFYFVSPFHHANLCVFSLHHSTIIITQFNYNEVKVFIVTPFHHFATVFYHFNMWTCVYSMHHCIIFVLPQHHSKVKAYFVTPLHHLNISNKNNYFASYSKISHKRDRNEQKQELNESNCLDRFWIWATMKKTLG